MNLFKEKRSITEKYDMLIIVLGITLTLLIWLSVTLKIHYEREAEMKYSLKIVGNLARAFEEHILRTIINADQIALFVKKQYERGHEFDLMPYFQDGTIALQPYVLISIADENGNLIASSQEPFVFSNISDREHFQIHKTSNEGQLYISKPLLGRSSGKWSIQMTRRITKLDGSFGGVVVVSVDPFYFTRFYQQVDLGVDSVIALIGRDGTIRAWQPNQLLHVGREIDQLDPRLMREVAAASSGHYIGSSMIDGVNRIYSYRSLYNDQLIIYVGMAEAEAFDDYFKRQNTYYIFALICSLFVIGACHSLIKMKRLEREVLRLDRLNLIGEMAAGIGHEIRNPMTTVRGFLQVLKNRGGHANDSEYFNIMIDELDRANSIITEYLTLAKNKAVEKKKISLNTIIARLLPLLQADALMQSKYVVAELTEVPELLLDEKEIRQLLLNIVRNGLDAMSPGGKITIALFANNQEVTMSIKDEGKGIDSLLMGKIGTPFFTTKDSGTGLGLAICHSIAARHDARIELETSSAGTIFYVRFIKG